MSERRTFPGRASSVRAARHYAVNVLGDVPDFVAESVAIAVSELATNCVLHADTEFTVDVDRTTDRIRVEVSDLGGGVPTVRTPAATDLSGRGLLLVRELSDEWGVNTSGEQPGKSVWFSIHLSASPGATLQDADL